MKTGKYRLYIVWCSGEREQYIYNTEEQAQASADGYRQAFGSQVWASVGYDFT